MRHNFIVLLGALCWASIATASTQGQRIIVILQEGLGHELMTAAHFYSEKSELWDWRTDPLWTVKSLSTVPKSTRNDPFGVHPDSGLAYHSFHAWNGSEIEGHESGVSPGLNIRGYRWLIENSTDPRQAATAFQSGQASFNTAINWVPSPSRGGNAVPEGGLLIEKAKQSGMKTGLISDMPFTQPTLAVLGGVRTDRELRGLSALHQILDRSYLDFLVCTGHPSFNELGQALPEPRYTLCSQGEWQQLRPRARSQGWELLFGDDNLISMPNPQLRRLVIMLYGDTQSTRAITTDAGSLNQNLYQNLKFQIRTALNRLNSNPEGFLLYVHLGRLPHLLRAELQREALDEVGLGLEILKICESWIQENGGWDQSSLLLVSPYEYGLIWGADSSTYPFSPVTSRGNRRVPGLRINHQGSTATLTPLLSRGAMTPSILEAASKQVDPVYGPYFHLTDLHSVIANSIGIREVEDVAGSPGSLTPPTRVNDDPSTHQ